MVGPAQTGIRPTPFYFRCETVNDWDIDLGRTQFPRQFPDFYPHTVTDFLAAERDATKICPA